MLVRAFNATTLLLRRRRRRVATAARLVLDLMTSRRLLFYIHCNSVYSMREDIGFDYDIYSYFDSLFSQYTSLATDTQYFGRYCRRGKRHISRDPRRPVRQLFEFPKGNTSKSAIDGGPSQTRPSRCIASLSHGSLASLGAFRSLNYPPHTLRRPSISP